MAGKTGPIVTAVRDLFDGQDGQLQYLDQLLKALGVEKRCV